MIKTETQICVILSHMTSFFYSKKYASLILDDSKQMSFPYSKESISNGRRNRRGNLRSSFKFVWHLWKTNGLVVTLYGKFIVEYEQLTFSATKLVIDIIFLLSLVFLLLKNVSTKSVSSS